MKKPLECAPPRTKKKNNTRFCFPTYKEAYKTVDFATPSTKKKNKLDIAPPPAQKNNKNN